MGVSNAWAHDLAANQYVYFEKPSDWTQVALLLGHDSYSIGYNMTKISNTNLYYWKTASWGGYNAYAFIDAKDWGGEGNGSSSKPDTRKKWATHYSSTFTSAIAKCHLFNSTKSIKSSTTATAYATVVNRTQTIKVQLKDGSNWVDATVVPADLKASTYALTSSTAAGAKSASLAKESTTVSATVSAAYSAKVTLSCTNVLDGYVFDGWYDSNGNKITSYTVSDAHTVYARFVQSAEETNEVTVTYMCGTTSVATAVAEFVGVETEKSFTAPTVTGYKFTNWTIGAGITLKAGTASDATITVVTKSASSNYTLVANYEEVMETIYFINTGNWSVVNLHRWNGTAASTAWPGEAMTKTGEKIGEYDVYSFTAQQGAFANVIFTNKNTGSDQTGDLTWTAGKYYIYNFNGNSDWYTKDEAEQLFESALLTKVYLAGTMNEWSTTENEFKKATAESTTASVTVRLEADTYEFKLVISGDWKGNDGTMKRGGNGVHDGGWSFDGGNNCKIVADVAGDYTFTWNLTDKKLTVAYPPLPKYTVTATAKNGTVEGAGEYEQGSTATLTATPNDGYVFKNWTVAGAEISTDNPYSFTVTKDIALAANFAQEETHPVTVDYMCGTTSIKDATTSSVGVETPVSIDAPKIDGYTFQSWTVGDGIKTDNANTDNPISITTKPTGPYTLTANYTENPCVYFVNTARWTTINAYAWNDSENNGWPGKAMTKESEKISGYDVYKYVMPAGENYDKLIFNQGNDDGKTGDLEWVNGKYYVYSAGQWVDKNEVADLLPKPVIYFKNHLGWTNVYVYFFNAENWGDSGASPWDLSVTNGRVCKMEKVGETDIYKFDYSEKTFVPSNVIAFSKDDQSGYGNFNQTEAAYRTDYNPSMELYIPQKTSSETKNNTKYFNKGLWMKYNSTESGYTITGDFNSWNQESDKFTSETSGGYIFQKEMLLSSGNSYEFKIKNIKNDWFRTSTAITSTKNTDIEFTAGDGSNVTITALSDGYYIFSIDLSTGKMLVNVEYPLMVGDYRMVYIESETKGTKPYTKFHPAQSIRGITTGEKLDTVSFFINKINGKNPAILLQKCTAISGANFTWEDVAIQYINGNGGADPALAQAPARKAASITYVDGCTAVEGNGVYNFVMQQTDGSATFATEETHPYTGNYYIRTDGAAGGWSKYNTNPDNIMTHSETALTHGGYDYYFCEWMLKNNNVKYVVANDYNYCVSDTLAKDDIVTDENGNLPADANVRYTWNSSTNALKRAYINGSGIAKDRYLVLEGNAQLQDASGNAFPVGTGERDGLKANETTFADMGNWLYQVDVKASEETLVKLTANYNGTIQYFKGNAESAVKIITGATNHYKFRLIYDFKTNYLLCGLIEDGNIDETITVDEAMISRSHHGQAQTFQVASGKSITSIKTVYGVMNFNKTALNDGSKSQYERALYWVSFPFDVDLGKAFGFGNYGEHWIMEYYDGEARAKNGWWVDSDTYWEYIWDPKGYTLEAGKGYVLCLDLDLLKESASLWDNTDNIALYFPSKDGDITIDDKPALKDTDVKPLTCTIERDDRKTKDSNWNIIGVPAYTNFPDIDTKNIGFYYEYDKANNRYAVNNAAVFNCMHAYMVQFAGTIEWAYAQVAPAQMAARRNAAGKDQYTLRLALQQEGTDHDHTFIRLQEDNATAEFDMNYDLCKIINRGANIYSMIGNVEVAANVLPIEERVIPIGLDIEEDCNYAFAMPDGTDGITAILIDYETGKETNLLLADYTVELNAGIDNERFALRLRPSYVATEVENTILTDGNDNVKKYIIDGALYLLRDGKLYDAQGRMIQQ